MSEDFLSDALPFLESNDIVAAPTKMIFANGASRCRKIYPNASVTDQILTGMLSTQGMIIRERSLSTPEAGMKTYLNGMIGN